ATNLLAAQTDSLDKSLCSKVPRLERLSRAVSADADQRVVDRHWALISCLFRQYPDSAQLAMRSQFWLARQVETAIAAWIDSYCAYKPLNEQPAGDDAATADGATSGKGTSHGIDKAGNESTRGGGTESKGTATANGDEKAAVPGTANGAEKAAGPGTASGATPGRAAQPQRPGMRISRKIRFQYLDPRLELYKQLQFDLQNLSYSLAALKVFPEKYKS